MNYGSPATFTLKTTTNLGSCELVLTYNTGTTLTHGSLPQSLNQNDFHLMQLITPSKTYTLNTLASASQQACSAPPSTCPCDRSPLTCPPPPVCPPVCYYPPAPCVRFVRQPIWAGFGACRLFRRCW
jgi:hypothetical protein